MVVVGVSRWLEFQADLCGLTDNYIYIITRLISAGSPLHTIEQLFNSSALDLAIKRHDMTMVELLLRHRAHVAACT